MAAFLSFILAHQGDAADPELIHWIKERRDQLFGLGPWAVGVVMGLMPTKGLVLPFISYGGSAMVVHMMSVGMLLGLSSGRNEK